jgi:hypothetical protein
MSHTQSIKCEVSVSECLSVIAKRSYLFTFKWLMHDTSHRLIFDSDSCVFTTPSIRCGGSCCTQTTIECNVVRTYIYISHMNRYFFRYTDQSDNTKCVSEREFTSCIERIYVDDYIFDGNMALKVGREIQVLQEVYLGQ